MNCEICGRTPWADGVALFRQNDKGVPGIWRCGPHNETPPSVEVAAVVEAIAGEEVDK